MPLVLLIPKLNVNPNSKMKISLLAVCLIAPLVLGQFDPNVQEGRTAYVHLFEWKWTDIAAECERFLGPKGFGAVQISPPNEHAIVTEPFRPWWERYQPVSYKLISRSGNEEQFIDMVKRCNNVGVRIYVDAIINHMARNSGMGTAGSTYDARTEQFPGVPYGPSDFNGRNECPTIDNPGWNCIAGNICNYNNVEEVRNCRLEQLPDLAVYKSWPRDQIVGYLNRLIDIGVAGFRIDAAKHMWPTHVKELLGRLKNLNTQWFDAGSKAFIYQEVIDMGFGEPITAAQYIGNGRVSEFKYGKDLSAGVQKLNGLRLKDFKFFGTLWPGFLNGMNAVTFIDNHDNQRGHGGGGAILTFRQSREYKIANAFMLAHPYGFPQVMSSYNWPQNFVDGKDKNDWIGPPSKPDGTTLDITINENDGTCNGEWRCEHRWRQITNMVGFRNVAGNGGLVHWWTNGENQIAFGRGVAGATTAFIAINNDNWHLNQYLQTGLSPGVYCDVISGNLIDGQCTGRVITVNGDRGAQFSVPNDSDPVVAIHVQSKRS